VRYGIESCSFGRDLCAPTGGFLRVRKFFAKPRQNDVAIKRENGAVPRPALGRTHLLEQIPQAVAYVPWVRDISLGPDVFLKKTWLA